MRPVEAAEAMSISRSKAYELIAEGKIPSVRIGRCVRVPVQEFRTWAEKRVDTSAARTAPASPPRRDARLKK
jgi:excisionase family DNA binding protein